VKAVPQGPALVLSGSLSSSSLSSADGGGGGGGDGGGGDDATDVAEAAGVMRVESNIRRRASSKGKVGSNEVRRTCTTSLAHYFPRSSCARY
jgi:hypothetical protein